MLQREFGQPAVRIYLGAWSGLARGSCIFFALSVGGSGAIFGFAGMTVFARLKCAKVGVSWRDSFKGRDLTRWTWYIGP